MTSGVDGALAAILLGTACSIALAVLLSSFEPGQRKLLRWGVAPAAFVPLGTMLASGRLPLDLAALQRGGAILYGPLLVTIALAVWGLSKPVARGLARHPLFWVAAPNGLAVAALVALLMLGGTANALTPGADTTVTKTLTTQFTATGATFAGLTNTGDYLALSAATPSATTPLAAGSAIPTAGTGAGAHTLQGPGRVFLLIRGNGLTTTAYYDGATATYSATAGPTIPTAVNAGAFSIPRGDGSFVLIVGGSSQNVYIVSPNAGAVGDWTITTPAFSLQGIGAGAGAHAIKKSATQYVIVHGAGGATSAKTVQTTIYRTPADGGGEGISAGPATTYASSVFTTSSTTAITAGTGKVVTPAAISGVALNDRLVVDVGAAQETIVVTAVTATTFTANFANAHGPAIWPISTSSITGITAGAGKVVTPRSMTGIVVGSILTVDTGGAQETVTVTAVTATTFTATFAFAHGAASWPIVVSAATGDGALSIPMTGANAGKWTTFIGGGRPNAMVYDPTANAFTAAVQNAPSNLGAGANAIQYTDGTLGARWLVIIGGGAASGPHFKFDPSVLTQTLTQLTNATNPAWGAGTHAFKRGNGTFLVVGTTTVTRIWTPGAGVTGSFTASGPAVTLAPGPGAHTFQQTDGQMMIVLANTTTRTTTNLHDAGWTGTYTSEMINPNIVDFWDQVSWTTTAPLTLANSVRISVRTGTDATLPTPAGATTYQDFFPTGSGNGTGAGAITSTTAPQGKRYVQARITLTRPSAASPDAETAVWRGSGGLTYDRAAGVSTSSLFSNTTATTTVAIGAATVTPVSMTGIVVGSSLLVGAGASQETVTVTAATGTTFTATFTIAHGPASYPVTTAPVAAGSVAVAPASMAGIVNGTVLSIDAGSAQEQVTVTAVTATTFTATFANAHGPASFYVGTSPAVGDYGLRFKRALFYPLLGTSTPTAGVAFSASMTLKDTAGTQNAITEYTGNHTIFFSGANTAPDGTVPIVTVGASQPFGGNIVVPFTAGATPAGATLTLYNAVPATSSITAVAAGPATVTPGGSTTSTTTVAAGSVTVTPASMVGIVVGTVLQVDGGAAQETVTVTAITATTFTATFANGHGPSSWTIIVTSTSDMAGIVVGARLLVDTAAAQEYVTVSAVTATTFTATFANAHGPARYTIAQQPQNLSGNENFTSAVTGYYLCDGGASCAANGPITVASAATAVTVGPTALNAANSDTSVNPGTLAVPGVSTITTNVRDNYRNPINGVTVIYASSRGGVDSISPPPGGTGGSGQPAGQQQAQDTSSTIGTAVITVTAGGTPLQSVTISFTAPPGQAASVTLVKDSQAFLSAAGITTTNTQVTSGSVQLKATANTPSATFCSTPAPCGAAQPNTTGAGGHTLQGTGGIYLTFNGAGSNTASVYDGKGVFASRTLRDASNVALNVGAGATSVKLSAGGHSGQFLTVQGGGSAGTMYVTAAFPQAALAAGPSLTGPAGAGAFAIAISGNRYLIVHAGATSGTSIYQTSTDTIVAGPTLTAAAGAGAHGITRSDGTVLIVLGNATNTTNVFDPTPNTAVAGPAITVSATNYPVGAGGHAAQLGATSWLIVTGGGTNKAIKFDSSTSAYTLGGTISAVVGIGAHTMQRVDGTLLIVHGGALTTTTVYTPGTDAVAAGPATSAAVGDGGHAFPQLDHRFVEILGNGTAATNLYDAGWVGSGTYATEYLTRADLDSWNKVAWTVAGTGTITVQVEVATSDLGSGSGTALFLQPLNAFVAANPTTFTSTSSNKFARAVVQVARPVPSLAGAQTQVWLGSSNTVSTRTQTASPTLSSLSLGYRTGLFNVSTPAIAFAGVSFPMTVTLKDLVGTTLATYSGARTLVFDGASNAPIGTVPTAAGTNFGTGTSVTFPAATSSTTTVAIGAATVTPVSMNGISVGSVLVVDTAAAQETVTVTAATATTFTATFTKAHGPASYTISLSATIVPTTILYASETAAVGASESVAAQSLATFRIALAYQVQANRGSSLVNAADPDATTSTFTAAPTTVPGDGTTASSLTVTAKDVFGNLSPSALTTATTTVAPGTVVVTPLSMAGIAVGRSIVVDSGGSQETVTVTAVTGTTFTAVFAKAHGPASYLIAPLRQVSIVSSRPAPDTITPASGAVSTPNAVLTASFTSTNAGTSVLTATIAGGAASINLGVTITVTASAGAGVTLRLTAVDGTGTPIGAVATGTAFAVKVESLNAVTLAPDTTFCNGGGGRLCSFVWTSTAGSAPDGTAPVLVANASGLIFTTGVFTTTVSFQFFCANSSGNVCLSESGLPAISLTATQASNAQVALGTTSGVAILAGATDATKSFVIVSPSAAAVSGIVCAAPLPTPCAPTQVKVWARVLDAHLNPAVSKTVALSSDRGTDTLTGACTTCTDAYGYTTALTLSSTTAGASQLSATVGASSITAATVTFFDASALRINNGTYVGSVLDGVISKLGLAVVPVDALGKPFISVSGSTISSPTVTWSATGAGAGVFTPAGTAGCNGTSTASAAVLQSQFAGATHTTCFNVSNPGLITITPSSPSGTVPQAYSFIVVGLFDVTTTSSPSGRTVTVRAEWDGTTLGVRGWQAIGP